LYFKRDKDKIFLRNKQTLDVSLKKNSLFVGCFGYYCCFFNISVFQKSAIKTKNARSKQPEHL